MRVFSTFSGIGGFEIGIYRAFEATQERVRQKSKELIRVGSANGTDEGHEGLDGSTAAVFQHAFDGTTGQPTCVGYSEIDRYASSVYERHFKGVKNYGDITKINADELPEFDCLVGGFPCQAFSIAGKRGGFSDTRGTLFFDLARILRAKQPRLFVFENVKGLLSHDGGRTFATIIQTIDELGYDCQWQVLNSKNHGVPQNRERIIIVGHLRGTPRPEVFPIINTNGKDIVQVNKPTHSNDRIYSVGGVSPSLNTMQGGNRQPKIIDYKNLNSETRRGRLKDGYVGTLETNPLVAVLEGSKIRRLTPIECERLQAFPDNWTQYATDGSSISDTQRYKMCGNAVTTNVIQAVFERIFASTPAPAA